MKIKPRQPYRIVQPKNEDGKKIQKFLEKIKKQFSTESSFNSNEALSKRFLNLDNFEKSVNNYLYVLLPKYSDKEWKIISQETRKFISEQKPVEEYLLYLMTITPKDLPKEPIIKKEPKVEKQITFDDLALTEPTNEEIEKEDDAISLDVFEEKTHTNGRPVASELSDMEQKIVDDFEELFEDKTESYNRLANTIAIWYTWFDSIVEAVDELDSFIQRWFSTAEVIDKSEEEIISFNSDRYTLKFQPTDKEGYTYSITLKFR
jgi:hypothetical protein